MTRNENLSLFVVVWDASSTSGKYQAPGFPPHLHHDGMEKRRVFARQGTLGGKDEVEDADSVLKYLAGSHPFVHQVGFQLTSNPSPFSSADLQFFKIDIIAPKTESLIKAFGAFSTSFVKASLRLVSIFEEGFPRAL
jgi:hypothetical protein